MKLCRWFENKCLKLKLRLTSTEAMRLELGSRDRVHSNGQTLLLSLDHKITLFTISRESLVLLHDLGQLLLEDIALGARDAVDPVLSL